MLDIKFIRENPEKIKEAVEKRGAEIFTYVHFRGIISL